MRKAGSSSKTCRTGDYLLGYEIRGGKQSNYSDYPTRYFPSVGEQARASIVHLVPMQVMSNLKFSLARPHTPRSIRVEVVWPNGTPAEAKLTSVVQW